MSRQFEGKRHLSGGFPQEIPLIQEAIGRLLGRPEFAPPLEGVAAPVVELATPELLHLSLCQTSHEPLPLRVSVGDEVVAGQPLAGDDAAGVLLPSPVAGTVVSVSELAHLRGGRKGDAVDLRPAGGAQAPAFAPLDPRGAEPAELAARLREAGVLSSDRSPRPLQAELEGPAETLVVLAADRDPGVSVALQLLAERGQDVCPAAALLARICGARRIVVALLEQQVAAFQAAEGVELLPLPARYPKTLPAMVARRLGGGAGLRIVPLESALAALDAVRLGQVQARKLVTLIGPDQRPVANSRVMLGTPLAALLAHAGIEVSERDKVIAGGPMRGFAQWSLDGVVDAGLDALTVIRAGTYPDWTAEPCVNSGRCIDICPVDLQVQLIGRYAEFELFDQTAELGIDQCFECGLCAAVCTARRPLLQYIRLAKAGLEASA